MVSPFHRVPVNDLLLKFNALPQSFLEAVSILLARLNAPPYGKSEIEFPSLRIDSSQPVLMVAAVSS